MSWLGKILTFLVLIGAVVWGYFTVSAYSLRTNWKARADAYEKAFKDSEARREQEKLDALSDREALVRMFAAERARSEEYGRGYDDLARAGQRDNTAFEKLVENYTKADVEAQKLSANLKTVQDELKFTRERNVDLEDKRQQLVLQKADAERKQLEAQNYANLQRTIADEYAKKIESLTSQVTELRQSGGGGGAATVLRTIDKIPAPLPENIRGNVVRDISDDLVEIDIGIDAGLSPGSQLDVYRTKGSVKYLGTLTVTGILEPKKAVGTFRPARRVPVGQLRPDELPRAGDTVGQLTAPSALR